MQHHDKQCGFTENDIVLSDADHAIFVTTGFVFISNDIYTDNIIPSIVSESRFVIIESSEFNGNVLSSIEALIKSSDIKVSQSTFAYNTDSG